MKGKQFLAALLAVLGTVFIISFMFSMFGELAPEIPRLEMSFVFAVAATWVSLIITLVWGLPTYILLEKLKMQKIYWYQLSAATVSLIYVIGLKPFGDDSISTSIFQIIMCLVIGVAAASAFWFVGVRKRA